MLSVGHIVASMRTDQGRIRDHNEDFIASHEPAGLGEERQNGWLYIVADGVGGAQAGEIASQFATERTVHHFLANKQITDWGQRLVTAMTEANAELRQIIMDEMVGTRMATTMVATVIHDDVATFANVGDSRGYHWREGSLIQITKDHSLVARLVEEGAITEEEAVNHPRRNVILHSLGSENLPQIDTFDVALIPGEQLILCSDGLIRHVANEEIAEIVEQFTPDQATERLIQLANERGGEDNISVAVLRIGEQAAQVEAPPTLIPGEVTSSLAQLSIKSERRTLLIYTAILCLVQIILIFLIWLSVSS